jgi:DNA-binding transcriptional regulator YhcF (GntR family)
MQRTVGQLQVNIIQVTKTYERHQHINFLELQKKIFMILHHLAQVHTVKNQTGTLIKRAIQDLLSKLDSMDLKMKTLDLVPIQYNAQKQDVQLLELKN